MATDKVRVAVRVRPFNRRELELNTSCIIGIIGNQTSLYSPITAAKTDKNKVKSFTFDHCFLSMDPRASDFANQDVVFNTLGKDILHNAFQGYNACIFAYGQTGSGKSYTMMGSAENLGIIPRLCDSLFNMIAKQQNSELTYKVEVSYIEIYNERVHDLLDPKTNKQSLKVREHSVFGPYVDGLSQLAVTAFQDIDNLMAEGNKSRTVAATNMNSESSRSHAVFSVILTQTLIDSKTGVSGEKVSRISLVDLAGSERAVKTGAIGERLREGNNINKSLTTLGLVISKLADQNSVNRNRNKFIPYRDSVLTWLLKDNLGGNSKTVMVATISPAADNYEETLSTLRYADRAKRIINHAVVNEDPNARIIRELRQEVETLKEMLLHATGQGSLIGQKRSDITEKITESEKLMKEISQTWEEKLVKTEKLQHERQQTLEKMGISVQASGIKVRKNKYYLVNLNDDPSLNELLVYYLKDKTSVGGEFTSTKQDIVLHGLGILPEHCTITIEDNIPHMTPHIGARCFVNGIQVKNKTTLQHGDRIVWGNHHFFRVNCPKPYRNSTGESETPIQYIDYNFAKEELMLNELSNNPIQRAIATLEKEHEEDKQVALEKQRLEYERQFQQLRNILSPSTPYLPHGPCDIFKNQGITMSPCVPTTKITVSKWDHTRNQIFKHRLNKLKTDILKANALIQEANFLAEEMSKQIVFSVTLQIPPSNLSPNRKEEWLKVQDPFYELQENYNLVGVANLFLEILFHDISLNYLTPIINQQGEVSGRLHVEISRIFGQFPQDGKCGNNIESIDDLNLTEFGDESSLNKIRCRVVIRKASGLPLSANHFIFCKYSFWGFSESIIVPSIVPDRISPSTHNDKQECSLTFYFDHVKDFTVVLSEEFIEFCSEGALSIEVWANRSADLPKNESPWKAKQEQLHKVQSLAERWLELSRKVELWVEIQELNEYGEYTPVNISRKESDILTGGIYQLRQGQQRRLRVRVQTVPNSGTLPIICQTIINISIGSIVGRSHLQNPLDSYQDGDLCILKEKWSDALKRRRQYLNEQIKKLLNIEDKREQDIQREKSLVGQWISLTEERNAVLIPAAKSGIPGAPADWNPSFGMEPHIPVLFLDLNTDELSINQSKGEINVVGSNSILSKEHGQKFYNLPIIRHLEKYVCAIAAWDTSLQDDDILNKVTEDNTKSLTETGVTYEIVSNIPKTSEELEDRESLAQIAASGEESLFDGETYIEKYSKGVSAVESILALDRLRQTVTIKELLQAHGKSTMRKTTSVPNITQVSKIDDSTDTNKVLRSESVANLHLELNVFKSGTVRKGSSNHYKIEENKVIDQSQSTEIERPTFLNLNENISTHHRALTSGIKFSPNTALGKIGPKMSPLHEEVSYPKNDILTSKFYSNEGNNCDNIFVEQESKSLMSSNHVHVPHTFKKLRSIKRQFLHTHNNKHYLLQAVCSKSDPESIIQLNQQEHFSLETDNSDELESHTDTIYNSKDNDFNMDGNNESTSYT